ncbi:MAG: hypothetical protein JWP25_6399 [Bradyrhizobium sp.]|jgi:uncharacterized OB-fold protein|nr:hypothetical protein [Bradyrhizobium sp.]MEA2865694.1 uncharacterized protein [Bradyrhizobium sp.]
MTLDLLAIDHPRAFAPRMTEFTRHFWQGLSAGRFETTRCDDCERLTFPPKQFCPHCWSKRIAWVALSGRGRLYSQTVVHAAPAVFQNEVPYRVGIVDLDEGLRIATRVLAGIEPELDTAVEIVVLNYRDGPLFAARPL